MAMRVGQLLRLRNDHHGAHLASEGFTSLKAKADYFRKPPHMSADEWETYQGTPLDKLEQVFEIVSVCESLPTALYHASSDDVGAAGRIDLELQKMASGPRLLAAQLETSEKLRAKKMRRVDLRELVSTVLQNDPRIAGILVAFESGVWSKDDSYALYCLPNDQGKGKNSKKVKMLAYSDLSPSYRESKWFRGTKNARKATWTDPAIDPAVGTVPLVGYCVPMKSSDGQFMGVVRMDVQLDLANSRPHDEPPIRASADEESKEVDENDPDVQKALRRILADVGSDPALVAEQMDTVRKEEILEDGWFDNTFINLLQGENKNILGAVISFRPGIKGNNAYAVGVYREKGSFDISMPEEIVGFEAEPWYAQPMAQGNQTWMEPCPADPRYKKVFDKKDEDPKMRSFVVPFEMEQQTGVCGIIRVDILWDPTSLLSSPGNDSGKRLIMCASCNVECRWCYYENAFSLTRTVVCLRCFGDGMLPIDTSADQYSIVESQTYKDYIDRYRKPSPVLYGNHVQLLHVKSGRFLSVGLAAKGSSGDFYKLELENDQDTTDPYLEGGPSTWFTIQPSSDVRSEGEKVSAGDQIRLVSTRWAWETQFADPDSCANPLTHEQFHKEDDVKDDDEAKQDDVSHWEKENEFGKFTLSSAANWRIVAHQPTTDQQLRKWIERKEAANEQKEIKADDDEESSSADHGGSEQSEQTYGRLMPPSTTSHFLRSGDLLRVRSSTSSACLSLDSTFFPYKPGQGRDSGNEKDSVYAFYGRMSYALGVKGDDSLQAAWRIEIVTKDIDDEEAELDLDLKDVLTWATLFRLRHCISGRYLARLPGAEDSDTVRTASSIETNDIEHEPEDTVFQFVPLVKRQHTGSKVGFDPHGLVTVDAPFYIRLCSKSEVSALRDDAAAKELPPHRKSIINPSATTPNLAGSTRSLPGVETQDDGEWWLNVAEDGVKFTSYRDEEDTFNAVKVSMGHQKSTFQAFASLKRMDEFIDSFYGQWESFGKVPAQLPAPKDLRRLAKEEDPSIAWLTEFAQLMHPEMNEMVTVLRDLGRYCALACNNSDVTMQGVIDDPRHSDPGDSGLTAQWRQEVLFDENVIPRMYAIMQHPLYRILVHFPSSRSSVVADEAEEEQDELADLALGLAADKDVTTREQEAAEAKEQEAKEKKARCRETALDTFRMCVQLGCIVMIDNATAAILAAGIGLAQEDDEKDIHVVDEQKGGAAQEEVLDFLLYMLNFSTTHSLGVQTFLALLFENGRDKLATLSLTGPQLEQLWKCWGSIKRRRDRVISKWEREQGRHIGDHAFWRKIQKQDEELFASARDFLRIFYAMCECDGMADVPNQMKLLNSIAAEHKRLTSKGSVDMSEDASTVAESVQGKPKTRRLLSSNESDDEDEKDFVPPPLLDLRSDILGVLVNICKESARLENAGQEILDVTEGFKAVFGLNELSFEFDSIIQKMRDDSLPVQVRARYSQLLNELYVDREVPRILVDMTPFIANSGKSQDEIKMKDVEVDDLRNISRAEGREVWDFLMDYLMEAPPKPDMNVMTLPIVKMTQTLVQLEYPDDEEDMKKEEAGQLPTIGRGQVGPGSQLNQLVTQLIPVLKVKQRQPEMMPLEDWLASQRLLVNVKTEVCKVFDILFDYRLNQRMQVFFSLREIDFQFNESGVKEPPSLMPKDQRSRQESINEVRQQLIADSDIEMASLTKRPRTLKGMDNISQFVCKELFSDKMDVVSPDLRLEQILLKLIDVGEDTDLVMSCFSLLQRQHKQAEELVSNLKKVVVLDTQDDLQRSVDIYKLKWDLRYLMKIELNSESEDDIDVESLGMKTDRICKILNDLKKHYLDDIITDGHMGLMDMFIFSRSFGDVHIEGLTDRVIRYSPSYKTVQDIFRMQRVYEDLLDVISLPLPVVDESNFLRKIFLHCYDLLILFVDGNPKNAKKLEKWLPKFWSQKHLGPQPTMLLTKMLAGNQELCEKIPASALESYLEYLSSPVGKTPYSWTRTAVPLQFLKAIVRVNDRLLPHIQTRVVKAVCESSFILGRLANLGVPDQFRKLVNLLNFDLSKHRRAQGLEEKSARASSRNLDLPSKRKLMSKQYYLELLSLLTAAAPCKYVYVQDIARRESEESAMLIRSSLPCKDVIQLLCELRDGSSLIPTLRFFEQVYGSILSTVNKRLVIRLVNNLRRDVKRVAKWYEARFGKPVNYRDVRAGAAPPASAAGPPPLPAQPSDPLTDSVAMLDSPTMDAGGVGANSPAHDELPDPTELKKQQSSVDQSDITWTFISYTYDVILNFLIGFYHSTFRVENASKEEVIVANKLFDSVADLAAISLHRDENGGGQVSALPDAVNRISRARMTLAKDNYMARASIAMANNKGFGIANCLNLLVHMMDPQGDGFRVTGKPSGLKGTGRWQPGMLSKLVKALQSSVDTMHKNTERVTDVGSAGSAQEQETLHLADMRTAQAMRPSSSMCKWIRAMTQALHPRKKQDQEGFFEWYSENRHNLNLVRKTILLIGEFAQDEENSGATHESASDWINNNSSKFIVSYLKVLRSLVEPEEEQPDDTMRRVMVAMGLPRILVDLVSSQSSIKVNKAALNLAAALLLDGFGPAQKVFYSDQISMGSNKFFVKLRDLLGSPIKILSNQDKARTGVTDIPERYGSWPLVTVALKTMQLFCEGHNLKWQQFLQRQNIGMLTQDEDTDDMGVSINLVGKAVDLLSFLVDRHGSLWYVIVYWNGWYDEETIERVLACTDQLIDTLTEVTQGPCVENQVELVRGRFMQSVNWLLDAFVTAEEAKAVSVQRRASGLPDDGGYGEWSEERQETFLEIQSSLLATLMAMLEGFVPKIVPRRIMQVINFSLVQRLMEIYVRSIPETTLNDQIQSLCFPQDLDRDDKNTPTNVALDYYIFLRSLLAEWERSGTKGGYSPEFTTLLQSSVFSECEDKFGDKVGSVEILRDDRLEVALFRIPAVVQEQSSTASFKEFKTHMVYSVNRDNQHAKIDDFLRESGDLIYELTSFPRLKKHWLVKGYPIFRDLTWYLAIAQNIIAVLTDDADGDRYSWAPDCMLALGILQTSIAFFRLTSFVASHGPTKYHQFQEEQNSGKPNFSVTELLEIDAEDSNALVGVLAGGAGLVGQGVGFVADLGIGIVTKVLFWVKFILYFIASPYTVYQTLYVFFSILGIFYPVAYCYHLLDLVGRSDLLKEVFSSLTDYLGTLASTGLLWFFLLYIFSAIGFFAFPNAFNNSEDCLENCQSKLRILVFTLTKGLHAGGGISDVLPWPTYNDADPGLPPSGGNAGDPGAGRYWWRVVYDDMYFLILVVIMLAIVSGIIIDAFGASRDHRHEVEEDQKNTCFICGLESSKFEQARLDGFQFHVEKEHNMWNYIYFLAYLEMKDENDYTGQESYVGDLVKENQIKWFPIDRSILVENYEANLK